MIDAGRVSRVGGAVKRSPYRAFVHRVHGGSPRAVEHAGELVELGNAADHSVGGETRSRGTAVNRGKAR